MLHTKFRGNRPAGSGEDFLRLLTIYGHGGHLGHVTRKLTYKIWFKMAQWFLRKANFNIHM